MQAAGFPTSMEFCHPVDSSVLQRIRTTRPHPLRLQQRVFPILFQLQQPCLIQDEILCFGWCLGCMDPQWFFSSRCLHVLLLFTSPWTPMKVYCLKTQCQWHLLEWWWRQYSSHWAHVTGWWGHGKLCSACTHWFSLPPSKEHCPNLEIWESVILCIVAIDLCC